jgi:hypothetical protein
VGMVGQSEKRSRTSTIIEETPRYVASAHDDADMVRFVFEKGADSNFKNSCG